MVELQLLETSHPSKDAKRAYESLVAIDEQKERLLTNLEMLYNQRRIDEWQTTFHPEGLPVLLHVGKSTPLIILSGEVGCGKTALANSIATPLAERLVTKIITLETPSNIRGSGMVGELSNRIAAAFKSAKAKVTKYGFGLLVIDEADDLATSRSQNQAHHEDRAGLNVLIKEIDQLTREKSNLAVLLITNRLAVLDPAIRRRTSLHLVFERPVGERLKLVLEYILQGTDYTSEQFNKLLKQTQRSKTPYSFSDLIQLASRQAILRALQLNQPFTLPILMDVLATLEPSPLLVEAKID
ncbi:MAG: ATPase central protein [Spirosoma sp.]|nr:ATPase central protein [Spirosoma sp.]